MKTTMEIFNTIEVWRLTKATQLNKGETQYGTIAFGIGVFPALNSKLNSFAEVRLGRRGHFSIFNRKRAVVRAKAGSNSSEQYYVIQNDKDVDFATILKNPLPESEVSSLGPDPPFLEECEVCNNTGFVPCSNCLATGVIRNERSGNVFYCLDCVGHKKVRCPSCGGKCYMCE